MSSDFGSDPWIDARLRDVPVPPGTLLRLEEIAATSDDELDETVREVPLPIELLARLERIPRLHRRRVPWRELSLAATLLIAAGLGLLNVPRMGVQGRSSVDGAKFVGQSAPAAPQAGGTAANVKNRQPVSHGRGMFVPGVDTLPLAKGKSLEVEPSRDATEVQSELATLDASASAESTDGVDDSSPASIPRRDGIFAAPHGSDRLPTLEMVSHSMGRGLAPPLVPGYDFLFQLKTGERPFVSPEVNPALASSPVPLVRDKSSYLSACESIAAGRLPAADDVRIEDFLAALDDLFPSTNDPVALHMAAGPAPFGEPGLQLLQVGLRAGGPVHADPATGAPRLVARGATLNVAFNPQVVQAYRLVGHATTTLTGPVAPVTQIDLTPGTESAGLFELWLKPSGGDNVATVNLSWHDPNGSAERHLVGHVSRPQFVGSFAEEAPSLQAMALAAETARVLRSHAAGRSLGRVVDLAAQVKPQLREGQSFGQLLQLVAQAEKVRANPGAGARRAAAEAQP